VIAAHQNALLNKLPQHPLHMAVPTKQLRMIILKNWMFKTLPMKQQLGTRLTKCQQTLKLEIGTTLIADLQKMEKNEERRPTLACHAAERTENDLEQASDRRMSSTSLCHSNH
jgi:hypothetical protein